MSEVDLNKYSDFVQAVTSDPSNDLEAFIARVRELNSLGVNVPLLLTGSVGLNAEGGEFSEIVKKLGESYPTELADFHYYLQRHIELDEDHHGPLAIRMVTQLCGTDADKWATATTAVQEALRRVDIPAADLEHRAGEVGE